MYCEKSKKTRKKLLPPKTRVIDIMSQNPSIPAIKAPQSGPKKQQIDKMPF